MRKPVRFQTKVIGFIEDGYGTFRFVAYRDPTKHIMKKWNALGLSVKVIDSLKAHGIQTVVFILGNNEYETSITKFIESGLEYDNGGDVQKFVKLEQMDLSIPKHRKDNDLNQYI